MSHISSNFIADFRTSILTMLAARFFTVCAFFLGALGPALGVTKTAIATGSWTTNGVWSPSGAPANGDDIIIPSGRTITHTTNEIINNVTINSGGTLVSTGQLRVNGNYTNNGTHSGAGIVRIQGTGTTMSGSGTISTTDVFRIDNKRTITAGSNLTRTSGNFRCPNGDSLINLGTLTLTGINLTGIAGTTFFNGSGGTLNADRAVLTNGSFVASATNNLVVYNRTGTGNQNLNATVDGYYNLTITGNSLTSQKRLVENTVVLNDFTITGSTFTHVDTFSLTVGGDILVSGGVLSEVNGTLILNGSAAQTLAIGDNLINDLIVSNTSGGVSIVSDTIRIGGTLTITSGTFTTNGRLVVVSDATREGSIGPITGTGVLSGNVRTQRYIDQGLTGWRFLCSPTTNATFQSWKDDFIMAGFPGSQFPNHNFTSVYGYDETVSGHSDSGFFTVSITNSITPGDAFWVYCGDSLNGTNPFTIDVTGPITQGSFNFGPTYTAVTELQYDGWNLMGNPYPSAIDWDSPNWTKTNIDNAIYLYNTDLDQYATYISGVGANGGNNIIPMGHGFYVHANASSPALIVQETAKSDTLVPFLRREMEDELIVRLSLEQNDDRNESVVRIVPASTQSFDSDWDAYYFPSAGEAKPGIRSKAGQHDLSIQSRPLTDIDTIDVEVKSLIGSAQIRASVEELKDEFCIVLWDKTNGKRTPLSENSDPYVFSVSTQDWDSRFALILARERMLKTDCNELTGLNDANAGEPKSSAPLAWVQSERIVFLDVAGLYGQKATVLNQLGAIALCGYVNADGIDISSLSSGVYILQVGHHAQRIAVAR